MQTPLFLRLFDPNVLHHHLGPQRHVSHSMPISMHYFTLRILIFCSCTCTAKIQNETYIKMRCVTKRRLKYSVNLTPQKLKYRANLISRVEFVSYKYKLSQISTKHRHFFLITCIYDATGHFCNCAYPCTIDNRHYACQTAASQEI